MIKTKSKKVLLAIRLTSDGVALLSLLSEKKGLNKSTMLEVLVREKADEESIFVEDFRAVLESEGYK